MRALTPDNADAEKIKASIQLALSECLEGMTHFDAVITDEMLVSMMLSYVTNCVFEQIVMESDRAFQKATTVEQAVEAETELNQLVKAVVDNAMRPMLGDDIKSLSAAKIQAIQLNAIREVWTIWEGYDQ